MKIIPAIDLKDGKCVRLLKGKEDSFEVFNNEEPVVLATGGFSRLFRSSGLFHSVIPDLALHGIHISLKLNHKQN